TICSRCSVGCSVTQWQRRGQLVRVTSRENDDIDEGWICDRGRFDYTDVNDPSRVRTPTIAGRKSTWADAINLVAARIKGKGAKLSVVCPEGVDLDRHPSTVHIRNAKGAAAAEVRKLASHELLKNPGGPVAILFGDGHGSEDMNELAAACGDLAEQVGGKEMPLYRATNESGALAAGVAGRDKLDGGA